MRRPHLLRTETEPAAFSELFTALRELGLRAGWLDLEGCAEPPADLEEAAASGAFRAVGVRAARVVSVKPVAGPAVLEDLLREHFAGCRLVVVRGPIDAPELVPADGGWTLRLDAGVERRWTTGELARVLRKPHLPGIRSPAAEGGVPPEPE